MSFILDALRKSDAERQRTAAPGLADVRYAARRVRQSVWVPILALVLAANMVFMGVQWFGRGDDQPAETTALATEPAPADAIRPLARETEFGEPLLEPETERDFVPEPLPGMVAPPAPEALPPPQAPQAPQVPQAPQATDPAVAPVTPSRILVGDDLPTAEELIGTGGLNLPILNLDLHVYSEKPASRFVIISSRKYKEGGQLSEGPTVETITQDGVILAYQGRRFTLARR